MKLLNALRINKWLILCWIIVCFVSYITRLHNYNVIPKVGMSMDEFSNTWVGMSIIAQHYPVGISGIGGYKYEEKIYLNVDDVYSKIADGNPLTINYPWFDHPPLMGMITGGFAWFKGARSPLDATTTIIRKPMILIGTVTTLLVMVLAYLEYGSKVSILSGLLMAVSPMMVISSRMVQGENGIIPCWLLAVILYKFGERQNRAVFLMLSGVISGVAILFKLSGIVVPITITWLIFNQEKRFKWKDIFSYLFSTFIVASLFVVYGLVIDAQQFINTFLQNSERFYGLGGDSFYNLLTQFKLSNIKVLTDPWLLIGWMSVVYSAFKKNNLIILCIGCYLIVYFIFGNQPHGWYAFPIYPWLIISVSNFLVKFKNNVLTNIFLMTIIGWFVSKIISYQTWTEYSSWWRVVIPIIIIYSLLLKKGNYQSWCRWILVLISLGLSFYYTWGIGISEWYKLT